MDDFNKTSNHNDTSYCASVTEGEFFPKFFVHCSATEKIAGHVKRRRNTEILLESCQFP